MSGASRDFACGSGSPLLLGERRHCRWARLALESPAGASVKLILQWPAALYAVVSRSRKPQKLSAQSVHAAPPASRSFPQQSSASSKPRLKAYRAPRTCRPYVFDNPLDQGTSGGAGEWWQGRMQPTTSSPTNTSCTTGARARTCCGTTLSSRCGSRAVLCPVVLVTWNCSDM